MRNLKLILIILVAVSSQCYYLCRAERNVEHLRSKRSKLIPTSSWIFVDPDEDTDTRDILRLAIQITDDIRRGRFRTHEQFDQDNLARLGDFTRPPRPRPAALIRETNPCNQKLPDKPNFNVAGRRISEAKCDEFQWDLKRRHDKEKLKDDCRAYNIKHANGTLVGPAVVGGRDTEPGEFPHMGALGWRTIDGYWVFQCGASLISTKFLLTAAHCSIVPRDPSLANPKPEIVRLGVTKIISSPIDVKPYYTDDIRQIIVHPQYSSPKQYYDIALVELVYELTILTDFILPACLWTRPDTSTLGNRAFATGWGYLDAAGTQKAENLQAAEVNIIDSTQCNSLLKPIWNRNFNGIQSHQLCAGVLDGGVDACQGDSGGPLQVKIPATKIMSYIIGVTSFGRGCARPNSPGVYTRVSSFIDWIESIVWRR